ncbi:MAG: hypothetical protein IMW89_05480 [Ktedonobacteraceae bacterium]|nr:hypothetical protein [Ktedonobacteraceae bacterium]
MNKQEIESYLTQLGQELQDLGVRQTIHVVLIGGAFMLTQVDERRTTDDIDVLFKDIDDITVSPIYQTFKMAARTVAARNGLKGNWINDVMNDFLRNAGIIPEEKLWRRFGRLEVLLPPKEYVLALKLLAGRPKDRRDIEVLCQQLKIRTRDQAQRLIDRYIPDKRLQQINDLDDTLDSFFS